MISRDEIVAKIKHYAVRYNIPQEILYGICMQESNLNSFAIRYEPNYKWLFDPEIVRPKTCSLSTEVALQKMSFGTCIAKDEMVLTDNGFLPIQDISKGNKTFDRNSKFSEVFSTFEKESNCLEIKIGLNLPLNLTHNHKLFVKKATIGKHRTGRNKIIISDNSEWVEAQYLNPYDMIAMPFFTTVDDVEEIETFPLLERKTKGFRDSYELCEIDNSTILRRRTTLSIKGEIPSKIKINKDFLELCGLYLAEGCGLEFEKGCAFTFNINETYLHTKVIKLFESVFGITPSWGIRLNQEANSAQVYVYGLCAKLLPRILRGTATEKEIPSWMLFLPPEKQKWLIYGAMLGDGCFRHAKYTTASIKLAYGFAYILQRMGIVARIVKLIHPKKGNIWYDIGLNSHDAVKKFNELTSGNVSWIQTEKNGKQRNNKTSWKKDDFIYFPVRSVSESGIKPVYDLQVPSDSTFVVGRSIVHNCQIMGAVCREYGFRGWLTEIMTNIDLQFEYGCRHLASKIKKYGLEEGILSYNSGSPRKDASGQYINQHYLTNVLKFSKEKF